LNSLHQVSAYKRGCVHCLYASFIFETSEHILIKFGMGFALNVAFGSYQFSKILLDMQLKLNYIGFLNTGLSCKEIGA
jgi:hypothetical protein